MKKRIVLFGAGPHSEVIIDIVEKGKKYKIVGLIDSKREIGSLLHDYPVIGRQEDLINLIKRYKIQGGIICVGDNWRRKLFRDSIINFVPNFNFVSAIHPSCNIGKNVSIGNGTVIMPGVTINVGANIGDFCIINTNSSFEHYCEMGDFSSISAGVTTGGFLKIGDYSAIALGVTIFDRLTIGKHTIIGSSALVTKDIPDNVLAYGVPAKIVRSREIGEQYLK